MTEAEVLTPSTALIVRPRTLPTTAQFAIETQLAWKLRNARGFLPNHFMVGDEQERSAKILAAIEYARAVGIEPMIALQNTQVIDGKVGASALLIGALLRKSGYAIADDTNNERSIVTVSKNGSSAKGEFSMEDAQRAQLVKPNSGWQKYPRDMMYARALTQAARRGAQDAVLGMAYTAEELGGIEEEIAGVPFTEGEGRDVPGVSEAVGSLPAAAIQPTPPAPSVEVAANAVPVGDVKGQTVGELAQPPPSTAPEGVPAAEVTQERGTPAAEAPQAPPQTPAPFAPAPLSGASVSRRMGRSIGPQPKRTNTVEVPHPVTGQVETSRMPATAPEAVPSVVPQPEPVPSPPAASDLVDDPGPIDEGRRVYLDQQRELLRAGAAELAHVNALLKNQRNALTNEPVVPVPPKTPTTESDQGLARLIERDYPGRTLSNLGEPELQNRLELVEGVLADRRRIMAERGISEE